MLACLPREDLASYSSSNSGVGGAPPQSPSAAGSSSADAGDEPASGQGGEGNPTDLPLSPDGMGSLAGADASSAAADAGSQPDAALTADGGAAPADAGFAANQCAASQGTLVPNEDVCLIFVAEARVSWQAASLACQSRNAILASAKTAERDQLISSLIDTDIWLGGFDPGANAAANDFVWRDQSEVDTSLAAWAAGEPDAVADQFCVAKAPPALGGEWRDAPCAELKAYVCEQTL